jgi:Fe-S oxidoreductase
MQAKSKWSCIRCGVVIPYNPQYDMSNTLCSNCATYQNADKLLGGYRSDKKKN